jgi:hypothetical protein
MNMANESQHNRNREPQNNTRYSQNMDFINNTLREITATEHTTSTHWPEQHTQSNPIDNRLTWSTPKQGDQQPKIPYH